MTQQRLTRVGVEPRTCGRRKNGALTFSEMLPINHLNLISGLYYMTISILIDQIFAVPIRSEI